MKKVSLTCSVFLLLSIIVFASFAVSCGGGGGGVSAARGGNNAGKGGYGGGSGEVKVFVNGKLAGGSGAGDGSSASEEEAAKASSAKFSEGIMSLDWTTMDFKLWVNGQLYFSQTLNKGDTFAISGLKLGDHVKATGTFTTSDGTPYNISGSIPSVENGSKLSMYVTYTWTCSNAGMPAGTKIADGASLSGTYTAEAGAVLPTIQCLNGKKVEGWLNKTTGLSSDGKVWKTIPPGTTGNLTFAIDENKSLSGNVVFEVSGTTITGLTDYGKTLSVITIPEGIVALGSNLFNGNTNITKVVLPSTIKTLNSSTFYGASNLEYVNLPEGITSLPYCTFYNCNKLKNVKLPSTLISIGNQAFNRCYEITSIEIPSKVTTIGQQAFNNCTNLTSIVLPSSLQEIQYMAFENCPKLSSLIIPASVTAIGAGNIFSKCGNAVGGFTLIMQSIDPPSLGANAFLLSSSYTIKVPNSALDTYKDSSYWSAYSDKIFGY